MTEIVIVTRRHLYYMEEVPWGQEVQQEAANFSNLFVQSQAQPGHLGNLSYLDLEWVAKPPLPTWVGHGHCYDYMVII